MWWAGHQKDCMIVVSFGINGAQCIPNHFSDWTTSSGFLSHEQHTDPATWSRWVPQWKGIPERYSDIQENHSSHRQCTGLAGEVAVWTMSTIRLGAEDMHVCDCLSLP